VAVEILIVTYFMNLWQEWLGLH